MGASNPKMSLRPIQPEKYGKSPAAANLVQAFNAGCTALENAFDSMPIPPMPYRMDDAELRAYKRAFFCYKARMLEEMGVPNCVLVQWGEAWLSM
jgi:hypothetical protein